MNEWKNKLSSLPTWVLECLVLSTFLCLAVLSYPGIVTGRPITSDHVVHFTKASILNEALLEKFQFFGWSDIWFAGFPYGHNYPIGGDLLVVLVNLATLDLLDFEIVYNLAILLVQILQGYSLYLIGKRFFNGWIGFVAGILIVTHFGTTYLGGWYWYIKIGVWPSMLATSFILMACSFIPTENEHLASDGTGIFALLMGLSIICHPLSLIFWVAFFVAYGLYEIGRGQERGKQKLKYLSLKIGLGFLVGSLWLLPFFSSTHFSEVWGAGWLDNEKIARGLISGSLFGNFYSALTIAGTFGIAWAMLCGSRGKKILALTCLFLLLLGNDEFRDLINLKQWLPSSKHIQYNRLAVLLKPLWTLFGLVVIFALLKFVWAKLRGKGQAQKSASLLDKLIGGVVLSTVLIGLALHYRDASFFGRIQWSEPTDFREREALLQWLTQKKVDEPRFFRLIAGRHKPEHDHLLNEIPVLTGIPLVRIGYTPAVNFKYQLNSRNYNLRVLAQRVNARYFLTLKKEPAPPDFFEVAQFGRYQVFENRNWRHEKYTAFGSFQHSLASQRDEEIVVDVSGNEKGHLVFHSTFFDRWHAYVDGKEVPLATHAESGAGQSMFMKVNVDGPGRYSIRYQRSWPERSSPILFILGILVCIGLHLNRREPKPRA